MMQANGVQERWLRYKRRYIDDVDSAELVAAVKAAFFEGYNDGYARGREDASEESILD
jgi:hypothetical protein